MTLANAFLLGPLTMLMLLLSGSPLTIETFPLYIAGGLGTVFWTTAAGVLISLFTGR